MNVKHLLLALAGLTLGAPAFALTPCHLPQLAEQVECGAIDVPEDRSKPDGRRIVIRFARIPASARPAAPDPLLVLAGGPGQAAIDYTPMLSGAFREVRKRRDILLIDQRGTGRSSPLRCTLPVESIGRGDTAAVQASLRHCASTLQADPRHYHTAAALADFEDVRRALGYRQVSLWGGSYGTRTALMYARRYPASVRSMVLDSVAPPDVRILLNARQAQAALDRLLDDCALDPACRTAFPHLARDLDRLLAMPAIGDHAGAALPQLLRGPLYTTHHASVLHYAIHAAASGRPQALLGLYGATAGWSTDGMAFGQTLSTLCAEEAPFIDDAAVAADAGATRFGPAYAQSWRDWCAAWPAAAPDHDAMRPVVSNIPTLLLAGGLDPVTSPGNARVAARTLRRSRVLVAERAGHIVSGAGCAPRLIGAFLGHADPAAVDGRCLDAIRRPPFVLAGGQPTL